MIIACTAISWATVMLPGLTLIFTVIGIAVAYYEARVTQKIALSNRRISVYVLLRALTNALQRAYDGASMTMPNSAADFAVEWSTELEKEIAIIDLCKKVNIGILSLNLLQLKDVLESDFSSSKYIFFVEKSTSGVDVIGKELRKYGDAHTAYCQSCSTSFTNADLKEVKECIDTANQSIASMDKEMTVRNIFNW